MTLFLPDGSAVIGSPWEIQELLNLRNPVPFLTGTQTGTLHSQHPWGAWCQEHQRYKCTEPHSTISFIVPQHSGCSA